MCAALSLSTTVGCGDKKKDGSSSEAKKGDAKKKGKKVDKEALSASLKDGYGGVLGKDGFDFFANLDEPAGEDDSTMSFAGAAHSPEEPERFSAVWVGHEAGAVLRRAIDKDLEATTVSAGGHQCLIFHEDRMVRRLVFTEEGASNEYAFSAAGHIILWFESEKSSPYRNHLAFFHDKGRVLKLHQTWEGQSPRRTEPPLEGTQEYVNRMAKQCLDKFGAKNPSPGAVAAPPPPVPAPTAPPEGNAPQSGQLVPTNTSDIPIEGQLYELVAKHSSQCLEAPAAGGGKGQKLVQSPCNRSKSQHFRFWIRDNSVMITSEETGMCLDVDQAKTDNETSIIQWPCAASQNQLFKLERKNVGEFRFSAVHSGRCIDIRGSSQAPLADLIQFDCADSDNEHFFVRRAQ